MDSTHMLRLAGHLLAVPFNWLIDDPRKNASLIPNLVLCIAALAQTGWFVSRANRAVSSWKGDMSLSNRTFQGLKIAAAKMKAWCLAGAFFRIKVVLSCQLKCDTKKTCFVWVEIGFWSNQCHQLDLQIKTYQNKLVVLGLIHFSLPSRSCSWQKASSARFGGLPKGPSQGITFWIYLSSSNRCGN